MLLSSLAKKESRVIEEFCQVSIRDQLPLINQTDQLAGSLHGRSIVGQLCSVVGQTVIISLILFARSNDQSVGLSVGQSVKQISVGRLINLSVGHFMLMIV